MEQISDMAALPGRKKKNPLPCGAGQACGHRGDPRGPLLAATMISTLRRTSSAASSGYRSRFPSAYRYSMAMFCPSMWPSSRRDLYDGCRGSQRVLNKVHWPQV